MIVLVVSLSILAIIIVFFADKSKLISPIKFFVCLWAFILILSCVRIGILNKPVDEAYILLIIMLFSFLSGSLICKFLKNKEQNQEKTEVSIREKIFYALCIAYILFNIIDIIIVVKYRMQGVPMWQIRNWSLQPYGSVNPILSRRTFAETIFRNIILEPLQVIIYPVTAYYFFSKQPKFKKIFMLILAILSLLTCSLAGGGGRLVYIYFVLSYLLAFISMYKTNQIDKETVKKYKRILLVFTLVAFVGTVVLTIIRVGKGSFLKQVYVYFAMPPTLLSEWLPIIKDAPHTYGMLTTFGIHSYFFRTLNQIGLTSLVPSLFTKSFTYLLNAEKFLAIGKGESGNAFVTPVYYFYLDGGYPFVIGASLFFGFIIEYVYKKIYKNFNIRSFMIYMLIIFGVLVSFMRIQTVIPSYIISIVYIILLTKKRVGEQHEKK